jgi:ABC-2 type transport system permease protein
VGGEPPSRWWPLILGVLAGTVLATTLAVATAALTPLPELAQLTTVPVSLGLFGGGFWLLDTGASSLPMLAAPGVPVAELIRMAWRPAGGPVVPCVLAITATCVLGAVVASRRFRFDPRSASL